MRGHMLAPMALLIFAGLTAVLTLVAPFDSARFGVVPRFGYWLTIVVPTYAAGYAINAAFRGPRFATWSRPARVVASALCTALAVSLLVLTLTFAMTGVLPPRANLPVFIGNTFAIAGIVAVLMDVILAQPHRAPAGPAPLLSRLPHDKRAPLVSISVEDHYVRVRTTQGEEMLLLRLSDAMAETGETTGMQVHRSHWVALNQVKTATRTGDRAILMMAQGPDIPVSRRYIPALKEAGLLP